MNGVIYARYSNGPRQTYMSIEGQIRDCTAYAEKKGITITGTYIDEHISGKEFENREALQQLMKDAKKSLFDCVIVWKIDRLGRCREELAFTKAKLKRCGVHLYYAMEHIPEGPEGIILESLMEGLAEYYSAELSQKLRRGMREAILSGKTVNARACFGYILKDRRYIPDPERKDLLVEIFERYVGGETAAAICDDLRMRGVKTADGANVERKNIYKILRNEKYTGMYVFGDIRIPDFHERLISDELFKEAQEKLAQNSKGQGKRKRTEGVDYILTGKLYCGKCKNRMTGESGTNKKGVVYRYYTCHGRKNKKSGCDMKPLPKEMIEDAIIRITQKDVLTDEMINHLAMRVMELQASDAEDPKIKAMERTLRDTNKKIDNIMTAIESGIITPTTKDRLLTLEADRERISAGIAGARAKKTTYTEDEIRFYLKSFRDGDADNPEFARNIVDVFVNMVYIYDDYAVMFYNFTDGGDGDSHDFAQIADEAVRKEEARDAEESEDVHEKRGTCSVNVPLSEASGTLSEHPALVFVSLITFAVITKNSRLLHV